MLSAMSTWMGWTGRSSMGENWPTRMRHSKTSMTQVKVTWLTSIITMKYAAKSAALYPPTWPPRERATLDQTTSETAYTNYVRVAVARSSGAWTVTNDTVSNAAIVTFAQCGVTGATLTYFGIGSDSSGAGNLFFSGALTSQLIVSNGITPSFAIGALTTTAA